MNNLFPGFANGINFGAVGLLEKRTQEIVSSPMAADTQVTASITNDTSGGGFTVRALRSYNVVVFVKPTEVAGKRTLERTTQWQQMAETDGASPVTVRAGGFFGVEVQFTAPAHSTESARTAVLQTKGDNLQASMPLTALVGQIVIKGLGPISLDHNQTLSVPITVISAAGPPSAVSLTPVCLVRGLNYSFPVTPSSVQVSQNNPASAKVGLVGNLEHSTTITLGIKVSAFDGVLQFVHEFPVRIQGEQD